MSRQLKKFNIGGIHLGREFDGCHVYIGAHSKADASRLVDEYFGRKTWNHARAITIYGSDCWGTPMDGIELERGIWVQDERINADHKIKRVI